MYLVDVKEKERVKCSSVWTSFKCKIVEREKMCFIDLNSSVSYGKIWNLQ